VFQTEIRVVADEGSGEVVYPFFSSSISVMFYLFFNLQLSAEMKGSGGGAPPPSWLDQRLRVY